MSRTEPTFITESTYWKYRDKQDADFKSAFTEQASLIEKGNKQLNDRIDNGLKQLHDTFDNKLSTVNGTLSGRLRELKNDLEVVKEDLENLRAEVSEVKAEVSEVKAEVSEVKAEVSEVKGRLDQMDSRLTHMEDNMGQVRAEMKGRFSQMEGRSINKSRILPYDDIEIIGIYREPIGLEMPAYFPKTIKEFWKLKNSINKQKLIYLIRFYDIKNFEYWGQTYRDFEDDTLQLDLSLENAIERHPEIALEKLAEILNLSFDEICGFFRRAAEYEQSQQSSAIKRHTATPRNEVVKRPKNSEPQPPLELLIEAAPGPRPTSAATSSASARISWDVSARNAAAAEMKAKMKAEPSSPGSSKDSSTDVISSRESRRLGNSKKPRSNKS